MFEVHLLRGSHAAAGLVLPPLHCTVQLTVTADHRKALRLKCTGICPTMCYVTTMVICLRHVHRWHPLSYVQSLSAYAVSLT
jgi:hypothetical protein